MNKIDGPKRREADEHGVMAVTMQQNPAVNASKVKYKGHEYYVYPKPSNYPFHRILDKLLSKA